MGVVSFNLSPEHVAKLDALRARHSELYFDIPSRSAMVRALIDAADPQTFFANPPDKVEVKDEAGEVIGLSPVRAKVGFYDPSEPDGEAGE